MDDVLSRPATARRIRVRGAVQGVGFRPFVYRLATGLALDGWVRNDGEGVEIAVGGPAAAVDSFIAALRRQAPPLARVDAVELADEPRPLAAGFRIDASGGGAARTGITADAATCADCLADLCDPRGRRWRYAFTNCTHCGPRFTITARLPYDRPHTSMAGFALCPACRREYDDPLDRRFHAQPNACPACGPRLTLADTHGRVLDTADAIAATLARLRAGQIVALKGLGGFHLVCNALDPLAVARLRERKHRDEKPFALMFANPASAQPWAQIEGAALAALQSPARPIVLVPKRPAAEAALPGIAPGLAELGVLLPYTPLHWLLFHEAAGRPAGTAWACAVQPLALVMTSANPGGEPLVIDNLEAVARLGGIADAFVWHDRPILIRCDDSVVRAVGLGVPAAAVPAPAEPATAPTAPRGERPAAAPAASLTAASAAALTAAPAAAHTAAPAAAPASAPAALPAAPSAGRAAGVPAARPVAADPLPPGVAFIRRARGYTPAPIRLPRAGPAVLATGGYLKNTACLTRGAEALLAQHIGDLDNAPSCAALDHAVAHLQRVFAVTPAAVAHDLHPDSYATRLALRLAAQLDVPALAVQHHHAHVAAVLAEHGVDQPALGLALDGVGLGEADAHGADTLWGGELLCVDGAQAQRLGRLRPLSLPGGDRAAREPWRMAAAVLHALGRGDEIAARFAAEPAAAQLATLLVRGIHTPATSSAGRWFDAAAALLGVRRVSRYEGQAAMQLEALARQHGAVAPALDRVVLGADGSLDLLPLAARLADTADAAAGAALFHATFAAACAEWVARAARVTGLTVVALGGGCFMNGLLSAQLTGLLAARGLRPLVARQAPCNDGGLALGQAWVAVQRLAAMP